MYNLKLKKNGLDIEVSTEAAAEVASLISALGSNQPKVQTKTPSKTHRRAKSPRAWQRWTMGEVKALRANRDLKPRDLVKIPELSGRSKQSLGAMSAFVRNPHTLSKAPGNFRRVAAQVLSEA